jgi:hypothetical protein
MSEVSLVLCCGSFLARKDLKGKTQSDIGAIKENVAS